MLLGLIIMAALGAGVGFLLAELLIGIVRQCSKFARLIDRTSNRTIILSCALIVALMVLPLIGDIACHSYH